MKIVVAPDSFKGSLSSKEAADAIELGIIKVIPDADIIKIPIADGGEGTVQALVEAMGGEIIRTQVIGPLGETIESYYGVLNDRKTAIIEMANASGLTLVPPDKKNPMLTTSYGTGQLIKSALDLGIEQIVIGLGGSATNDGGVGMAQALGVRFIDKNGRDIGFGGGQLGEIREIDISGIDERIRKVTIQAACDVDNPLCGPNGASHVYGPQKGADKEMIHILDENLKHLAKIIKRDLGADIIDLPGAGAAGGLGAGLAAFLNAELNKGFDIIANITSLDDYIKDARVVFTGEGQIDKQILSGKAVYGVAKIAKKYGTYVIAIVGGISDDAYELFDKGIDGMESIIDKPMTVEEACKMAKLLVERAAERVMRMLLINIFEKQRL